MFDILVSRNTVFLIKMSAAGENFRVYRSVSQFLLWNNENIFEIFRVEFSVREALYPKFRVQLESQICSTPKNWGIYPNKKTLVSWEPLIRYSCSPVLHFENPSA